MLILNNLHDFLHSEQSVQLMSLVFCHKTKSSLFLINSSFSVFINPFVLVLFLDDILFFIFVVAAHEPCVLSCQSEYSFYSLSF